MTRSRLRQSKLGKARFKAPIELMSDNRRLEVVTQFTEDVLSKLTDAFLQVAQLEGWGKRDLSSISGIDETAIGHILAGRRKNLTVETIALLTSAMRKRPELILRDLRLTGNKAVKPIVILASTISSGVAVTSGAAAINSDPSAVFVSVADV
jgi:hypothetical protein